MVTMATPSSDAELLAACAAYDALGGPVDTVL